MEREREKASRKWRRNDHNIHSAVIPKYLVSNIVPHFIYGRYKMTTSFNAPCKQCGVHLEVRIKNEN